MHSHLRTITAESSALPLEKLGFRIIFFDAQQLDALVDDGRPILLPATNEMQAEALSELRGRLGCSLSPLVALVDDYSGHQTYLAIKRGASRVVNLAIALDHQIHALQVSLACGAGTTQQNSTPTPMRPARETGAATVSTISRDTPDAPHSVQRDESDVLVRLLCSDETVSSISRKFFCSERTMYRKIRSLYEQLNVESRTELRALVATNRHGKVG
ncbi:MAG: LuxR C-terminal-related transcriptional regulator [Rhodococcus sp. (in: high G+C Gram-positive bacteria)]